MKYTINLFVAAILGLVVLQGCDKEANNPVYEDGASVTLTPSVTTVAPPPADSNKVALTLNWSYPNYSTDSSNIKYVIEIDSAGKNFANAARKTVVKDLSTTYIAKELNAILLAKGYAFNVPVDMDVRIISSYLNNNERRNSNTVRIKMTPYKVPPKVALPTSGRLFIVGDATTFGWSNDAAPAFPADREFAKIDETTWGGVFFLDGAGAWKLLQTQGNWDTQYHMVAGGTASEGSFILENADPGVPSPAAGWYRIIIDFQTGKYKLTAFVGTSLPTTLYVTGDGAPSSWTENPPANQQLTRLNSAEFQITMSLQPGKNLKFLTTMGQWQPQWGGNGDAGNTALGGNLKGNYTTDGANDPQSVATPATAGNYKVKINFATNRYTVSL